jgi:hypothetical protein
MKYEYRVLSANDRHHVDSALKIKHVVKCQSYNYAGNVVVTFWKGLCWAATLTPEVGTHVLEVTKEFFQDEEGVGTLISALEKLGPGTISFAGVTLPVGKALNAIPYVNKCVQRHGSNNWQSKACIAAIPFAGRTEL